MLKEFRRIAIRGVTAAVPRQVREMRDFFPQLDERIDVDKVIRSTGIERSRVTDVSVTATDLCQFAAEKLLSDLGLGPSDIDGLILVTATPDYMGGGSQLIQHRLGLRTSTQCFDLPNGCNGYIAGLSLASFLITSGFVKNILLCAGETVTKCLRPSDQSTLPLFGDAGSATLVQATSDGVLWCAEYVDGSGNQNIYLPNSGYRKSDEEKFLVMKGPEVFEFAARSVPPLTHEILSAANVAPDAIDWYVFHQASKVIIEFLSKKMKLPQEKVLWSLRDFGNTGSASIPLTLVTNPPFRAAHASRRNVFLSGFGVGWAWGGIIADLTGTHFSELVEV